MMNIVGYLVKTRNGLTGESGQFYNYVMAGNGLFITAEGPLICATVRISEAEVRGLAPLEENMRLTHGKVPWYVQNLAVSVMCADSWRERFIAVVFDGQYRLEIPEQLGTGGSVEYTRLRNTVVDIHSHPRMAAYFSGQDNRDEQGLGIYAVVGNIHQIGEVDPVITLRVGVYGYFGPVELNDVFEAEYV